MNNIEVIIFLVLLFMGVPDLCRKIGRPALAFSLFVVFGLIVGPLVSEGVKTMLTQAGQVGFLLLLFEVGLEIDLPKFNNLLRPLRFASGWSILQYPIVWGFGYLVGLGWMQCMVASAALTACSVGMSHPAWKGYPGLDGAASQFILTVMVALETLAIVLLAVETTALGDGLGWFTLVKLSGICLSVFLIARFSTHLTKLFSAVIQRTTRWRVHILVLVVLSICAVGQRLGLDAAKTAFFLGLFMSQSRHQGKRLEDFMAPISHQFLIPVFFVALGLQINWRLFMDPIALLAAGTSITLLGGREILHRRWFKTGGDSRAFLLFCPNLTIVALAAKALMEHGAEPKLASWLVLTGLFMTIASVLLLPLGDPGKSLESDGAQPK